MQYPIFKTPECEVAELTYQLLRTKLRNGADGEDAVFAAALALHQFVKENSTNVDVDIDRAAMVLATGRLPGEIGSSISLEEV